MLIFIIIILSSCNSQEEKDFTRQVELLTTYDYIKADTTELRSLFSEDVVNEILYTYMPKPGRDTNMGTFKSIENRDVEVNILYVDTTEEDGTIHCTAMTEFIDQKFNLSFVYNKKLNLITAFNRKFAQ